MLRHFVKFHGIHCSWFYWLARFRLHDAWTAISLILETVVGFSAVKGWRFSHKIWVLQVVLNGLVHPRLTQTMLLELFNSKAIFSRTNKPLFVADVSTVIWQPLSIIALMRACQMTAEMSAVNRDFVQWKRHVSMCITLESASPMISGGTRQTTTMLHRIESDSWLSFQKWQSRASWLPFHWHQPVGISCFAAVTPYLAPNRAVVSTDFLHYLLRGMRFYWITIALCCQVCRHSSGLLFN